MLADYFQDRVARVIAALRLVLALIFVVALYAEPSQPVRAPHIGYALLLAYAGFAAIMLRIALVSWWHDFRLAPMAFLVDAAIFAFSVWLTESGDGGFNSPFMAFFFFLMFSVSLRWNWRATVLAAAIAVLAYLIAGGILLLATAIIDMQVFVRRLTYMSVIAASFVFFAIQSRTGRQAVPPSDLGEYDGAEAALRFVAGHLHAARVALLWEDRDEPPVLTIFDEGTIVREVLAPIPLEDAGMVRLFDIAGGRVLAKGPKDSAPFVDKTQAIAPVAQMAGIDRGLSASLGTDRGGRGLLIAGEMPGLAVDDLDGFRDLANAVVSIVAQRTLADLQRTRAVVQTREALARDLHDSVAQALAGASFGLEAIRRTIPADAPEAVALTDDLKATLRREQAGIREMIDRLKFAPSDRQMVEIWPELSRTAKECALRWNVAVDIEATGKREVAAPLAFECKQIVREAVANAVRHGKARRVAVAVELRQGLLQLSIANDGAPFGEGPEQSQPWSISERVLGLGGTIEVNREDDSATLRIELPLAPAAA